MHFSVRPGEGGVADWKQPSETPSTSTPAPTQKVDVPKPVEVKPKEIKPIEQPKVQVKAVEPPKAKPFIQPKVAIKKPDISPGELVQRQLSGMFEEKKDLKLKTSNAKVLQKELSSAKTEIIKLKRKLKDCDLDEQMSGFLAHVSRQYLDKFPSVKKHPEQAAQYYRERTRKAETARHYTPDKYISGKKEEEPKPKG